MLIYLAAAGVGTIGMVDDDVVSLSNLQRQVLYTSSQVGKKKIEMAAERLNDLYPAIEIELYNTRLNKENATKLLESYDVIATVNRSCESVSKARITAWPILPSAPRIPMSIFLVINICVATKLVSCNLNMSN